LALWILRKSLPKNQIGETKMANVTSPTERWFINLAKLQKCVKNLNHLTPTSLKKFSQSPIGNLTEQMQENINACCQKAGIGGADSDDFADKEKTFLLFLDSVGIIQIETALVFHLLPITFKHNHNLVNIIDPFEVMKMSLDKIFGDIPLSSNMGKKELDLVLNQVTPDDFYPTDGSFLVDGDKTLVDVIKQIIS
jgi:hypothetical protein